MKKTIFLAVFSAFVTGNIFAQKTKPVAAATDLFETEMNIYRSALKHYDIQTGISALYTALELHPERTELKDTLAMLYFAGERYLQASSIADEILKDKPTAQNILEIAATSKQALGDTKEALADFEKLYAQSKNVYHLYQVATLQYQLKRFGEASESLNTIVTSPDSEKQQVAISAGQNQSQQVSLRAAAFNVRGIISSDLNNKAIAQQNFEEALKIAPDFVLAKNNLAALNAPPSTGK